MIINRQNYQIWITDYYDGRLDTFQAEVLMDFLSDNPDLKAEFEDYPGLSVSPPEHSSPDKNELLRTPDELTNEQVEHFSIAFWENDLDDQQKKEIEALSKTDPRFRKNLGIYEKIKLKADQSEYPGKSLLLKIPARRRRTVILLTALSTAASIAILAGLFIILNRQAPLPTPDRQVLASAAEDQAEETISEKSVRPGTGDENPASGHAAAESTQSRVTSGEQSTKSQTFAGTESTQDRVITGEQSTQSRIAAAAESTQIIEADPAVTGRETMVAMSKIPVREEIRLDNVEVSYLLAETEPYDLSLPPGIMDNMKMTVREFLAFQFRKSILDEEDPGVDNLKAWEIADAGIKGVNTLLGWNMEFQAGQGEDGRLQNLRFTSELLKIDRDFKKSNTGL
ncbi:MAG: hypothetical protein V2I34_02460 [Bacteroidales bacterium]|jgi:hypothetical protein|nr:hypothetical protein [Bacteroidales bacterium]